MVNMEMDENPIVFIPGLFGSLGNDIIPGTGELDFGLAEFAYRPIMDNLEAMGYKKDRDLFVAHYNWTKENLHSAERYLIPVINKAKKETGAKKINIICHSMGGIVARAYIQSRLYQYDIDKLVMLGTPNSGSVNAYYFWGGGHLPNEELRGNVFYRILRRTFLTVFKIIYGENNDIKLLHKMFPSVQELLPSFDYGSYIFYEDHRYRRFIPIMEMESQNTFLNKINREHDIISKYGIRTYLISGIGVETNKYICVDYDYKNKRYWLDGKPRYTVKSYWGDGTVTYNSSSSINGFRSNIYSDHIEILRDCKDVLSYILGHRISYKKFFPRYQRVRYLYSIVTKDIERININIDGLVKTVQKNIFESDREITVKQIGNNIYCIVVALSYQKNIRIKFAPINGMEGTATILKSKKNIGFEEISHTKINGSYITSL
jgi:pimeloyl-ACP methyl ester carboxylesterase